jgi:hypothetical protein
MDNEMAGLTALDPRVAAADKFIQDKKIPPDQVPAFLLSMGQDPRLAGLVMRFRKLKQAAESQKAGQQAQTTAAQDINSAYNNMKQQEVEQAVRERQRMSGLATVPAPTLERAGFAGGGIVAFAGEDGSLVQSSGPTYEDMYAGLVGQAGANPQMIEQAYSPEDAASLYAMAISKGDEKTAERLKGYLLRSGYGKQMGEWRSKTGEGLDLLSQMRNRQAQEKAAADKAAKEAERKATITSNIEALRGKKPPPAPAAAPPAQAKSDTARTDLTGATIEGPVGTEGRDTYKPTPIPGAAKPEKVKELSEYEQELADIAKKRGYGTARKEYGEYLTAEQARAQKEMGVDKNLALAQAGFAAMQAASQPGGTFAGALGTLGNKYASDMAALRRSQQAMNREMRQSQYALAQADEAESQGRLRDAMGLRRDAESRAQRAAEHRDTMRMQGASLASVERRFASQQAVQKELAAARTAATDRESQARLQSALVTARKNMAADAVYQDAVARRQMAIKKKDKDALAQAEKDIQSISADYLGGVQSAIEEQRKFWSRFGEAEAVGGDTGE